MPFSPRELSASTLKGFVHRLHKAMNVPGSTPVRQHQCQELVAAMLGFPSWHAAIHSVAGSTLDPTRSSPRAGSWRWPALVCGIRLCAPVSQYQPALQHVCALAQQERRPILWIQASWESPASGSRLLDQEGLVSEWRAALAHLPLSSLRDLAEQVGLPVPVPNPNRDLWRGRALNLMATVLAVGVSRRDRGVVPLTPDELKRLLSWEGLTALMGEGLLTDPERRNLMEYMKSVPGTRHTPLGVTVVNEDMVHERIAGTGLDCGLLASGDRFRPGVGNAGLLQGGAPGS